MHSNQTKLVPKQVITGFERLDAPQASEWRFLNDIYEAKVVQGNLTNYYQFNPEGLYLEKRALQNWDEDANENLKETIAKSYHKNSEIVEFYEATKADGEIYYIVQLREKSNNQLHTLYLDSDGGLNGKEKSGY